MANSGTLEALTTPIVEAIGVNAEGLPRVQPSTVISLVTILASTFLLKGKNKQYGIAVGVGALVPAVATMTADMWTADNPHTRRATLQTRGPSMRRVRYRTHPRAIGPASRAHRSKTSGVSKYAVSSRNLDNLA